jgi:hypothetical protein
MVRKAFGWLLTAAVAGVVASQWSDITRYFKIEQMSFGHGRPDVVPAVGKHAYPNSPGAGAPDGTGDFDSAGRGGPVSV